MFLAVFRIVQTLFETCINEAVDSTTSLISSSCVEWWSSFVCRLYVAVFREGFWSCCWSVSRLAEQPPTHPSIDLTHTHRPTTGPNLSRNRATCKLQTNEDRHLTQLDEIWIMVLSTASFMHFPNIVFQNQETWRNKSNRKLQINGDHHSAQLDEICLMVLSTGSFLNPIFFPN